MRRKQRGIVTGILGVGLIAAFFTPLLEAQAPTDALDQPAKSVPDPGVITTRQTISPAGVPAIVRGRVYGVAFGAVSSELIVSTNRAFYDFDWKENKVISHHSWNGAPGLQSIRYDRATGRALVAVAGKPLAGGAPSVDLLAAGRGPAVPILSGLGFHLSGALSIAERVHIAAVPLTYDNQLALVDLDKNTLIRKLPAGVAPFGAEINAAGTIAYVSNWGGRSALPGDRTATAGVKEPSTPNEPGVHPPDRIVIDPRGIAATGVVTRIDLAAGKVTAEIPVGLHPTAIVWDEPHQRLYVANSNDDSVSVVDTDTNKAIRKISFQPFEQPVRGIAPAALALTPDGSTLFVACAGINAVAVVKTATGTVEGMIPSAWYPSSLAVSPDAKYLAIGTLFGVGSGASANGKGRSVFAERGAVHVVDLPDASQLANYTVSVAENNHLAPAGTVSRVPGKARVALPVPRLPGDPSLIDHVVLIVKENRTYDQVMGDMQKGNGDPSLTLYGAGITPNHHRLADQFVLLDNFYATGGVSADGHQWLTQANETEYTMWPGYRGRSYPYDGTDPIAYAKGGFIWDLALAFQKTVRVYGEFTPASEVPHTRRAEYLQRWKEDPLFLPAIDHGSPIPPLNRVMSHQFPGFTNSIPDVIRARIFLKDLSGWEQRNDMPNLVLLQLNCDHTDGTRPGTSTPKAMVADNDLAVGQVVEKLSKSRFWPRMAIFVVEDDAQNGVDHVDGHRTVALVISPYIRRGSVDSTFYSHQSILKSAELMLGLPPLSIFDRIAQDMRNAFQKEPDLTPYAAVEPAQSLFDQNPPLKTLRGAERRAALASNAMRFEVPDAAPAQRLNKILWHDTRGWNTPYPGVKKAVFMPMILDHESEDEDP